MVLKQLSLQNFRNYTKASFDFSNKTTIIIGSNGVGKSNLIEAIFLLATGKSNRSNPPTGGEMQLIQFGKSVCRIAGEITDRGPAGRFPHPTASVASLPAGARWGTPAPITPDEAEALEVVFADQGTPFLKKKYLVNGVARRRVDFAGHLTAVLFTPMDLELVSGQPGNRRRFLDEVLEQVDSDYRTALSIYIKALRQRNALLQQAQETGRRNEKQFVYWDELLIKNGQVITSKREGLIEEINARKKDFFDCILFYDKSIISVQRLEQYKAAEIGAGVTLVGPHRDDIRFSSYASSFVKATDDKKASEDKQISNEADARYFASRGQQRLIVLEMKLSQIAFMEKKMEQKPILLLDDIFSELDNNNIKKVLKMMDHKQVIITTTHEEFIKGVGLKDREVIELGKT